MPGPVRLSSKFPRDDGGGDGRRRGLEKLRNLLSKKNDDEI